MNFSHPRKFLFLSLCSLSFQFLPHVASAEDMVASPHEALLLKRIVEYWKDEDYYLAKKQILDFLAQYENSSFKDHLMAMLGDLYFHEENYHEAIEAYMKIEDATFKEKSFLKNLKALLHIGEYETVEKMAKERLPKKLNVNSEEEVQLFLVFADSLYRQGKFKEALPYFESLLETSFHNYCLLPLAEVYREIQEYTKAVSFYEQLLENNGDKKEEILFQIATLQAEFDKAQAANTFLQVAKLDGDNQGIAAFNHLALLHAQKEYESLLNASENLMEKILKPDVPLARYYIGSAHFALKNWDEAIAALEIFVQNEQGSTPRLKSALFDLMICARKTNDSALSERVLSLFESNFTNDPSYLQSFLINAQIKREDGSLSLNPEEIKRLLDFYSEFEGREEIVFQVASLLLEDGQWNSSRDIFTLFLEQYPQSEKRKLAWRHFLNISIEAIKKSPDNTSFKEYFAQDLEKVFAEGGILNEKEEQEHRFNLAKVLYELNRLPEALRELEHFITSYPNDARLVEAHLMAALCHKNVSNDPKKIASHLEKAILLDPEKEDAHLINLQLYDIYLTLSSEDKEKSASFLDKAADNLYASFMREKESVKFDNQIWLANHYYSKVKSHLKEFNNPFDEHFLPLKRSIATYEKILGLQEGVVSFPKESDVLLLEGEALKYAELLTMKKDLPQKIALLETLYKFTEENPHLEWKYQKQSLFELAKTYEVQEDAQKAIELYDRLLKNYTPSYLTHAALLQKTRLQFALLPKEERSETSPQVIDILNQLKDLQIKKQLHCEPVHLEAALDYVDVRVALCNEETKIDKYLFFLRRVREDFMDSDDVTAQEYKEAREKYPEKDKLYQMYMRYVDAEMLRLKGEKAKNAGQEEEWKEFHGQARQHFEELLHGDEPLTPFLREKIESQTILQ